MTGFYRYLFMAVLLAFVLSVGAQSPNAQPSKAQPAARPPLQKIVWKDDLIVFRDYGGINACADLPGSYHVKIECDTLTLVMDEDPCDARAGTLISRRWIKKPAGLSSP